ncbi:MAG: hypothetical protein LBE97_02030 [Holosporales bacterium]|jgi:hypothetical protein|nr:hypothetical protein [Holosporales bacterium]
MIGDKSALLVAELIALILSIGFAKARRGDTPKIEIDLPIIFMVGLGIIVFGIIDIFAK